MKHTMKDSVFLLLIILLLVAVVTPARAVVPYDRLKKEALIESFRQQFAEGDFAPLDKGLNELQHKFEKGEWSQYNIRHFFFDPFPKDAAFESLFNDWVKAYPKSYAAHYARGHFYYNLALAYDSKDVAKLPPEETAKAKHYLDTAIQEYQAAIKLTDKPVMSYADLMFLYVKVGAVEKSRKILDEARKRVPASALVRSQYMWALGESGKYRDDMRRIVAEARNSPMIPPDRDDVIAVYDYWLLKDGHYAELDKDANQVQQNYEDGKITDVELRNYFCTFACSSDPAFKDKYDKWVQMYPRSYPARLSRSMYLYQLAWKARGGDLMKDTSKEEVSGMEFYLKQSIEDVTAAVSLTRKPILAYKTFIQIARTIGWPKSYQNEVLQESLKIDPANFVVRYEYLISLQERWGGSLAQMEDFTEETRKAGMPAYQLTWFDDMIKEEKFWIKYHVTKNLKNFGQLETGF